MSSRRAFIKDIFGTVIGIALLPTALREVAESKPQTALHYVKYRFPAGMFRRYDILLDRTGRHWWMISDTEAIDIEDPKYRMIIETGDPALLDQMVNQDVVRFCSATSEYT